jgi:hypothetical protein
MTATPDGRDCIQRANATCNCSTNQIRCNRNRNLFLTLIHLLIERSL